VARLLLLNGPNLNLLGKREPGIYGKQTLASIEAGLQAAAQDRGHQLDCFQANGEQVLLERIHAAAEAQVACIIFNPAAYTHTSIALRDALLGTGLPFIEVHLSNIAARETFRRQSFFADIAIGTIAGFGAHGYRLALQAAIQYIEGETRGHSQTQEAD